MELKILLPCSQEPATGPCPEPDECNPKPHTLLLKIHKYAEHCLPFRPSDYNFVRISHISYAYYMPLPSHSPWFVHPSNTFSVESKVWSCSLCNFLHIPFKFLSLQDGCFLRCYNSVITLVMVAVSSSTRLHGVTSQKTALFILVAVKTWNRTFLSLLFKYPILLNILLKSTI
jgi:hypothetical protein